MVRKEKPLRDLISERKQRYEFTKNIYCPYLKEVVYFNNKGFFHATHDGRNKLRSEPDARMRLNLLPTINTVIQRATSLARPPIIVPIIGTGNKTGKELVYYELTCRVGKSGNRKKRHYCRPEASRSRKTPLLQLLERRDG